MQVCGLDITGTSQQAIKQRENITGKIAIVSVMMCGLDIAGTSQQAIKQRENITGKIAIVSVTV